MRAVLDDVIEKEFSRGAFANQLAEHIGKHHEDGVDFAAGNFLFQRQQVHGLLSIFRTIRSRRLYACVRTHP